MYSSGEKDLKNNKLNKTKPWNEIKFFWLFSTEFRRSVCLREKNLNWIKKWIPPTLNLGEYMHSSLQ